jgi:aerobic carbon-monoxide dehydrogenase medium subunit
MGPGVMLAALEYLVPSCIDDAVALRREAGKEARFIAGGTEIVPRMNRGEIAPTCLIELSRLEELCRLDIDGNSLCIGAMITHAGIEASPLTKGQWLALSDASGSIRSPQVTNCGTVGGNVCFGVPSADLMPPFLTLEANLHLKGPNGERYLPIGDCLIGPYRNALEHGEILIEVRLPSNGKNFGSAFCKAAKYQGLGLASASVATALVLRDGRIRNARIAIGSATPVPKRVPDAEQFLEGRIPNDETLCEAGRLVAAAAEPREDSIRASPFYKRKVLIPMTERAITRAVTRARAG